MSEGKTRRGGGEREKEERKSYGIAQYVQVLQCMQDVRGRHSAQGPNFLHADFPCARLVREHVDDGLCPVGAIPQQPQIAEGFLRAAETAFALAEFVAESNEE